MVRRNLSVAQLKEKLKGRLDLKLNGWEMVGDVMVVKLLDDYTIEEKRLIGETILLYHPKARTVVNRINILDVYRKPEAEVIAGAHSETILVENGCRYRIDPTRVMFSFGNKEERKRMAGISDRDEVVVDMFSCVGQFSIPIAKHSKPKALLCPGKKSCSI